MALIALCQQEGSDTCDARRTSSTLPFPFSFTWNAKDVSRLLFGSLTRMKAWCGRFALLSSLVVSRILRVSDVPNVTGVDKGLFTAILCSCSRVSATSDRAAGENTYFSLKPPTPAFLLSTETVASSKPHEEAAVDNTPELMISRGNSNQFELRMMWCVI